MKIALGQINPHVGDLEGNVDRCLAAVEAARRQGAELVVLPEMALPGSPARDLLLDPSFVEATRAATADLAHLTREGPPVVVGTVTTGGGEPPPHHPGLYNGAVVLERGEARMVAAKRLLPAHDVFLEPRWFLPGPPLPPVEIGGRRIGFLVGEDMNDDGYAAHPPADLLAADAEILVCIAASPYHRQVLDQRLAQARRHRCPLLYANLWGGNDGLIYDGRSFAVDREGQVVAQLTGFEGQVQVVDLSLGAAHAVKPAAESPQKTLFQALVLGVRDFVAKNRLGRAFLGLSGGIDSALVAAVAAEALGPERVTGVAIPSRYTDPRSTACARDLAQALSIQFEVIEMEGLHAAAEETLDDLLAEGTAAENVQARLRATIMMAFVNRHGGLLLNTSNKTELALGYGTLYGDLAGVLCPIADLTKPQVYDLARWINTGREVIPAYTLERPPSAELRPGQVDPFDYDQVAPFMERLVAENRSNPALNRSEHKRQQAGIVLKVSPKAFGPGRQMPITRV